MHARQTLPLSFIPQTGSYYIAWAGLGLSLWSQGWPEMYSLPSVWENRFVSKAHRTMQSIHRLYQWKYLKNDKDFQSLTFGIQV